MSMCITPTRAAAALLSLSLLTSCNKNEFFPPSGDLTPYYIRQIAVVGGPAPAPGDTLVYTFTYDRLGKPLTVKHPIVATGSPNAVFQYDKYGRLSGFVRPYDNNLYETYNKYFYNGRNEIFKDSQYTFGPYIDSVPVGVVQYGGAVHWYKYDGSGRIIQRTDSFFGGEPAGDVVNFTYDGNGDLVNGASYDNRVSYRRTNAIWMFLSNDYSVHNAFQSESYNAYGLPLAFQGYYPIGTVVANSGQMLVKYGRR
jgi:hypothetical protein